MERKKAVIKNSSFSVVALIVTMLLSFVARRFFVRYLGNEYLGYNGLFTNILGVLAISELGFVSAITYSLYKEYAVENEREISRLMEVYKQFYRLVALSTALLGFGASFFLKSIITGVSRSWSYIYLIYFIQLFSVVASYFLTYKRTLFLVAQKQYKYSVTDTMTRFIVTLLQIFTLFVFRNYVIYLCIEVLYNIIANIIVALMFKWEFPYIRAEKVSFAYFKERGFVDDIKNGLVGNIAGRIYFSTDAIVISKIIGISVVGAYSNYQMIIAGVTQLLISALSGLQPAIGNYVYSESYENVAGLYRVLNVLYYFVALFVSGSYICLFQPFVSFWLGEEYLLPISVVIALAINEYISWNHGAVANFRGAVGEFGRDKYFYVFSAICNIVLSVVLAKNLGLVGVVIGTIAGHMFFWMGRAYVVNTIIIHNDGVKYIVREIIKALYAVTVLYGLYYITVGIKYGLIGIILRGMIIVFYLLPVYGIVCIASNDGREFARYIKSIAWKRR